MRAYAHARALIARLVRPRRDWFNIMAGSAWVRPIVALAFGCHCASAAAVTCEEFAAFADTTQQLRDQGYPLAAVLAEADKLESGRKYTAAEIERIKDVVERAFGGMHSPLDILQECKSKRLK